LEDGRGAISTDTDDESPADVEAALAAVTARLEGTLEWDDAGEHLDEERYDGDIGGDWNPDDELKMYDARFLDGLLHSRMPLFRVEALPSVRQ
jgi:hypothetical protein